MPSRQTGSDGAGGVAIQAVAGVIIPAGSAGVLGDDAGRDMAAASAEVKPG